jgi:polypeptide N-acetylgalactosaminyltransferase
VGRNNARLASVWLDEYYSQFYFARAKKRYNKDFGSNYGDVSSRLELKRRLNCSSFEWYLNHVVPDMINPIYSLAFGEVWTQKFLIPGLVEF